MKFLNTTVAGLLLVGTLSAHADGTLTIGDQTYEFDTHGCQLPSGPDDPMARMLPRAVMTGTLPDGRLARVDVRNQLGHRIEFSAEGKMLYSAIWRKRDDAWFSDRGEEDGPLFRMKDGVLTARAHFKAEDSGEWVEGSLELSCD